MHRHDTFSNTQIILKINTVTVKVYRHTTVSSYYNGSFPLHNNIIGMTNIIITYLLYNYNYSDNYWCLQHVQENGLVYVSTIINYDNYENRESKSTTFIGVRLEIHPNHQKNNMHCMWRAMFL